MQEKKKPLGSFNLFIFHPRVALPNQKELSQKKERKRDLKTLKFLPKCLI